MPRDAQLQMRRDTAANWTSTNPTLAAGEYGFETDTGMVKIGDGSTAWASLQYLSTKMNDWASSQDTTAYDIFPRLMANTTFAFSASASQLRVACFTATRTMSVSTITAYCSVAGTDASGTVYRRMALYTISGTTITLVARTANTPSLFTTTGANALTFDTTGGYPATYTIKAGTRYAVGAFVGNSTGTTSAPQLSNTTTSSTSGIASATPRLNGLVTPGNADLPTTNQTLTDTAVVPFFRLS